MVQNEGAEAVIGGGLESITMLQNDFNKTNLFIPGSWSTSGRSTCRWG